MKEEGLGAPLRPFLHLLDRGLAAHAGKDSVPWLRQNPNHPGHETEETLLLTLSDIFV